MPNYYKEQQEVGEIGGSFSGTVKSIVPLPMVICCGRLGGRWFDSAGRFVFVLFFGKSCCFGGPAGVRLGILVHPKKRPMGIFSWVQIIYPNAKNRAPGVENDPF